MFNIVCIFQDTQPDQDVKLLVNRLVEICHDVINLPNDIQIEFRKLDPNEYGQTSLNPRYKNRITINSDLSLSEIVKPIIHELCHMSQLHENRLYKHRDETYIWEGKKYKLKSAMTYQDYRNLPWELDVEEKEKVLYKKILDDMGSKQCL